MQHIMTLDAHAELKNKVYDTIYVGLSKQLEGGIITEDLIVIGGNTGSGKSTIALFMACVIAKYANKVVYFNKENSPKLMQDKIKQLGFDYTRDFGEFDSSGQNRLIIISGGDINIGMIQNSLILHKPKALFIDLFSALYAKEPVFNWANKTLDYAALLASYAIQYHCAIFVTEQFSKDNKRVTRAVADDIKGGAGLTQQATKIFIIYRHNRQNLERTMKDRYNVDARIAHNVTELIIRKDRYGLLDDSSTVYLKLNNGQNCGFTELSTEEECQYIDYIFNKKGK